MYMRVSRNRFERGIGDKSDIPIEILDEDENIIETIPLSTMDAYGLSQEILCAFYGFKLKTDESKEETNQFIYGPCSVYLIYSGSGESYKIGISINPRRRLRQFDPAGLNKLRLVYTAKFDSKTTAREHEKKLHEMFRGKSIKKMSETFSLSKMDIEKVKNYLLENKPIEFEIYNEDGGLGKIIHGERL